MPFTIAPHEKVEGEGPFQDFRAVESELLEAARERANEIFSGFTFGGVRPGNREFGITQILPKHILGDGTATYDQTYTDPGSWTDIFNVTAPEDVIWGVSGLRIPDPSLIFSQLRWEVEDRRYPIVDIEEARAFESGFDVFLKQDENEPFIVEGESRFQVRGFQERGTSGQSQRVTPTGFSLFKNKELVITEDLPSA